MPKMNNEPTNVNYDARWFVWTIVFLVVTGISLVSYIALSDSGNSDISGVVKTKASEHKALK